MAKQKMTTKQKQARVEAQRAREARAAEKQERQAMRRRIISIVVVVILVIGLSFPTMALVVMGGGQ